MNPTQFRIVYEFPNGIHGVLFMQAMNETAARQLFAGHFPGARIKRVSPEPVETHFYEKI